MTTGRLRAVIDHLWPAGDTLKGEQVYMLLDGARDPRIAQMIRFGRLEYACLYGDRLTPRLQAAAPYLVHLAAASPLTHALLEGAWSRSWGLLLAAPAHVTLRQLRLHFKKYLRVSDEAGTELAFRFYDPRVLRAFLPTLDAADLRQFFAPLARLVVDPQGPRAGIEFSLARDGMTLAARSLAALGTAPLAIGPATLRATPLGARHADAWFRLQNDDDIVRFTRLPRHAHPRAARQWIRTQLAIPDKHTLVLTHPVHGVVGGCALARSGAAALFYYWIGRPYQGHGYGKAALRELARHASGLGIRRLYSAVFADNANSLHVMAAAGFRHLPGVAEGGDPCLPCYCWTLEDDAIAADALRGELQRLMTAAGTTLEPPAIAPQEIAHDAAH